MKQIFTLLFSFTFLFSFAQTTADFENLNLTTDAFLNGDDGNGGFSSGNIFLPNTNNTTWWHGWSISNITDCLLYTSPSPRDATLSRMPSSA